MTGVRHSRSFRAVLLTSAAGACLALAPAAQADINDPVATSQDPVAVERPIYEAATLEAQTGQRPIDATEPDPQIVIGHPGTPTTARDPENVTGIGQMIVDNDDGTIGLCTGTLINPRAVLFAAHCVNTRDASAYGAGGTAIGFGFQNNNNIAGASAFGGWLNGINGGAAYQTNTGRYMYNVNQVAWHEDSVEGLSGGFRQADIAIATLDTPATDIPTWALLFSQLPETPGGANGTGYHVNIAGYGNNGTGALGSIGGIDYRRRVAENMLGAMVSLDDFTSFLFGSTTGALPQNLYWIDFDDPRRGTPQADPRDFNAWRDNPTPNEGMTASGDSGGPLILDSTYASQLVIGVLSGGYTRFFGGAPANGYGTAAFYQPLYLYWDWIAENNPYRYVSSLAGNGNWSDGSHWVTNTDPNYFIIGPDGEVVNGVPTAPGTGIADTPDDKFGEACFEQSGISECYNYGTDEYTLVARPIGTDGTVAAPVGGATRVAANTLTDGAGTDRISSLGNGSGDQPFALTPSEPSAQADASPNALPDATIANGLPGATTFVPNNSDPNPGEGVIGRYFDVTLAATGITTLDTEVTIDRFAIAGGGAALNITSTGSLTSLIDITQATGTMQVNGALTTPGDYLMMTGGLNGTGTITTPYFTSMAGVIAPGTAGTTGTLTFRGNVILASGTRYLVDLGANGVSDRIAVQTNGAGTGLADLGGTLVFGYNAATLRNGNVYTILTSQGGISGAFNTPTALSAILTPKVTYSADAVTVAIEAGLYTSVVPQSDPVAYSYAQLLDRNRSQAGTLDGLVGPLDLQDATTIRATLNGLRPATETLVQSLALVGVDTMANLVGDRVDQLSPGSTGGTFARYGQPNQIAAVGLSGRGVAGLSGMGFDADVRADTGEAVVQEGALPESVNAFVAGGYLRGDSAPAAGVLGRDDYDGWYAAAGIETWNDHGAIGFAVSYTRLDGDGAFAATRARASLYQGSLYGKLKLGEHGFTLDAKAIAGLLDGTTNRTVSIVGTPYTLRSESGSLVLVGELGLGKDFVGNGWRVTPRVATRVSHIGFSRTREEGGPAALVIDREPIESIQGRAGITFAGTGSKFRPILSGSYVYEFQDRPSTFGANFIGGIGSNALFALNGTDRDYFEVGGGLSITAGKVDLSVAAETTLGRQDYNGQSYRASLSFKF